MRPTRRIWEQRNKHKTPQYNNYCFIDAKNVVHGQSQLPIVSKFIILTDKFWFTCFQPVTGEKTISGWKVVYLQTVNAAHKIYKILTWNDSHALKFGDIYRRKDVICNHRTFQLFIYFKNSCTS